MLIKIILIYLLIGAVMDLIGRIVLLKNGDHENGVKTFGDLCLYIIGYLLVIIAWPIVVIEGIMMCIKKPD